MKKFFVTGTDTSVGKTLVSSALLLAMQGHYWKPIQSGIEKEASDRERVQHFTELSDTHFFPSTYALRASLSPDQAAQLENTEIDLAKCILPDIAPLIVEGAGGVLVPVNSNTLLIDLMKAYDLPVIIVSRGTLGTINHTLLTIEVLRQRGLSIQGVVFSGELNKKSQQSIEQWGHVKTLFHIPFFPALTKNVFQYWVRENKKTILEHFV